MVAGHMTKKNGYWYLILMVRDETGRLKQKWISTHLRVEGNKKKAEAMLLAARREYTDFAEIQKRSSDVLVSHYLTTWVKSCRGKVSFGTYEEYQNCINNRIAPYFKERNILLLDLKPADILDYYNSLYAKGLTGNTVLHYHVLLRKALKEASMRGFVQNDPTDFIPRPKKEQSAADCYSLEECRNYSMRFMMIHLNFPLRWPFCMDCGAAKFWGCDGVLLIMSKPQLPFHIP